VQCRFVVVRCFVVVDVVSVFVALLVLRCVAIDRVLS
jgi:hypothetical protein